MVAKELSGLEKQSQAKSKLFVVSPLISDQTNSYKRMTVNACKVGMEMTSTLLADEAYTAYKTNQVFGKLKIPDKFLIEFAGVGKSFFKIFTLLKF